MADLDYRYLAKLVKRAQGGDSDAFAELYSATYQKQYRFICQYVKDRYLAQDILQDVYILALKKLITLKDPMLFVSWLNQITFRLCMDAMQKRQREEQELLDEAGWEKMMTGKFFEATEISAVKEVSREELIREIYRLEPLVAQTIVLKYFSDLSVFEIAETLDCSVSAVKRMLVKGRKKLEKTLERYDQ